MIPTPPRKPKTLDELFEFYHNYVKVLYSFVQTENKLPNETLFELNAALDHISRKWIYSESEEEVVSQAYGHLKRSCLDIFKLKVKETRDQYDELRKIDTSAVDNGRFDIELRELFNRIRKGATEARRFEGDKTGDGDGPIKAFDRWQPVFADCLELTETYYLHKDLPWAKRRYWRHNLTNWIIAFGIGALSSFLVTLIA